MQIVITKSQRLRKFRTYCVALVALCLFLIVLYLLASLRALFSLDRNYFGTLIRVGVLGICILGVWLAWYQDSFKKYTIEKGRLIITNRFMGHFGKKQIIPLTSDKVSKLHLEQSFMGKKLDYGTIVIEMEKYSKTEQLYLRSIDQPGQVFDKIDSLLHSSSK